MEFNQFPHQFAATKNNEVKLKIAQLRNDCEQHHTSSSNVPSEPNPWKFGCLSFVVGYFIIYLIAGLAMFILGPVAEVGAVAFVPFWIWYSISRYKAKKQAYSSAVADNRTQIHQRIYVLEEQTKREIEEYQRLFESNAQKMSVDFAESKLATEVINWMTDGFSRTIDATDRRSHIEKINVPFSFNVYTNKITCNLGTYDFEIKRCADLTSPLQQTAIARAIASAIQLNITMKYPKDVTGTEFVLNTSYTYIGDCVSVVITYTAPNGNYQSVQSWKN